MTIEIPLNDLGMDELQMRELVNRMNKYDNRKWIFVRGSAPYSNQMANPFCNLSNYNCGLANTGFAS